MEQVPVGLLFDLPVREDTGMDCHQVVFREPEELGHPPEVVVVVRLQLHSGLDVGGDVDVDPALPLLDVIVEEVLLFVVADDAGRLSLTGLDPQRQLATTCAVRSSVDQVTQEQHVVLGPCVTLCQQLLGFFQTAVEVPDEDEPSHDGYSNPPVKPVHMARCMKTVLCSSSVASSILQLLMMRSSTSNVAR